MIALMPKSEEMIRFNRLSAEYGQKLGGVAYTVAGGRLRPEEATQLALEVVWKVARENPDMDNPYSFLSASVRNKVVDGYRSSHRRKFGTMLRLDIDDLGMHEMIPDLRNTSKVPQTMLDDLHRAIESLRPIFAQAISLRFWSRMTYPEIARELGVPVSTIENRLYRARILLREKMGVFMGGHMAENKCPTCPKTYKRGGKPFDRHVAKCGNGQHKPVPTPGVAPLAAGALVVEEMATATKLRDLADKYVEKAAVLRKMANNLEGIL